MRTQLTVFLFLLTTVSAAAQFPVKTVNYYPSSAPAEIHFVDGNVGTYPVMRITKDLIRVDSGNNQSLRMPLTYLESIRFSDGCTMYFDKGQFQFDKLVQPDRVVTKEENIAGVKIPSFEELTFKDIEYNVDDYPLWVDTAVFKLREIARLDALVATFRKQVQLLEAELRTTSQRVNLFEKVKIPEAKENIRVIQVFIGDQQTAAVVRGKIAKKKLVEV